MYCQFFKDEHDNVICATTPARAEQNRVNGLTPISFEEADAITKQQEKEALSDLEATLLNL